MTTDIEQFQFPVTGQAVRTVTIEGAPWFVSVDVCAVLDIANARQAVSYLDEDEVRRQEPVTTNDGSGRVLPANLINEAGLYSLILRSRKPEAKAFKRWITHEVLPSIRTTGSYVATLGDPLAELEVANGRLSQAIAIAKAERSRAEQAEVRLAVAAPKADAWDVLASAKGDYSVREAANILNRDPAIDTGQNRLFQKLRDLKLIDRNDIPYATHSRHVVLRTRHWRDPDGVEQTDGQVRITADGLRYLRKRLGASPSLPGLELMTELATTSTNGR